MIRELSEELINLISAGEVVERPLSVVKELVENSIDAKSSIIKIDLVNSGLKKITVIDNGTGISKEELPLSLKPHSTSKLHLRDDLFSIHSLGFRGEALPSIAQVSMFKITSKTSSEDSAYYIEVYGGKKTNEGITSFSNGTKVEVENLFFNTPARFKHLSNEQTELSLIVTLVTRFALANENISFCLKNNDKILFQNDGKGFNEDLLTECFGSTASKEMIGFDTQNSMYHVTGYTSNNNVFRSNKNSINVFCNNRIIKNLNLQYAITDAYQSIIPIGKYPITVLNITCNPELIDVNIHPSKMEIKFTDEQELRSLITRIISKVLHEKPLVYESKESDIAGDLVLEETITNNEPEVTFDDVWDKFDDAPIDNRVIEDNPDTDVSSLIEDLSMFDESTVKDEVNEESTIPEDNSSYIKKESRTEEIHLFEEKKFTFSDLRYIGQYHETYLLFENDIDLYLIDQHAAMERCMYERIVNDFEKETYECYDLLVPINIDFLPGDIEIILTKSSIIESFGIKLEHFGRTTFIVRTVPAWIPKNYEVEFISDIVNHIINDKNISRRILSESIARQLACKKSIKANMRITNDEVKTLLNNLSACKMPYTCPHGRPTLVKITNYEVEKMFKRVI